MARFDLGDVEWRLHTTVYIRFNRWARARVWDRVCEAL